MFQQRARYITKRNANDNLKVNLKRKKKCSNNNIRITFEENMQLKFWGKKN